MVNGLGPSGVSVTACRCARESNTIQYPVELGVPGTLAKFYNGGWSDPNLSEADCLRIGERDRQPDRAFKIREGLTRKDDTLPRRFLQEPMPSGPAKGEVVHLDGMLMEYYEPGMGQETGFPTRETLEELDLGEVADDMKKITLSLR